jgi:hypothetical protein
MVWDLRGALLKKEERESARLADFEFRHRARTFKLIAERLETDPAPIVALIARMDDEAAVREVALRHPEAADRMDALYQECRAEARRQLIRERGDPSPYRLL